MNKLAIMKFVHIDLVFLRILLNAHYIQFTFLILVLCLSVLPYKLQILSTNYK